MKFASAICFIFCLCMVTQCLDAARPAKDGLELIKQTCARTNYTDLCISSLTSDPNNLPSDTMGLAIAALQVASSNASHIIQNMKVMFNKSGANQPMLQDGLLDCLDEFQDASQQLEDSVAAVLVKAFNDVEKFVNVAIDEVHMCGAALGGAEPASVMQRNKVFVQLCQIAMSISKVAGAAGN